MKLAVAHIFVDRGLKPNFSGLEEITDDESLLAKNTPEANKNYQAPTPTVDGGSNLIRGFKNKFVESLPLTSILSKTFSGTCSILSVIFVVGHIC